jgi:hypothetical protein
MKRVGCEVGDELPAVGGGDLFAGDEGRRLLPSGQSPERSAAWALLAAEPDGRQADGAFDLRCTTAPRTRLFCPATRHLWCVGYSPRMTAVYEDPEFDEWPMLALDIDGS